MHAIRSVVAAVALVAMAGAAQAGQWVLGPGPFTVQDLGPQIQANTLSDKFMFRTSTGATCPWTCAPTARASAPMSLSGAGPRRDAMTSAMAAKLPAARTCGLWRSGAPITDVSCGPSIPGRFGLSTLRGRLAPHTNDAWC